MKKKFFAFLFALLFLLAAPMGVFAADAVEKDSAINRQSRAVEQLQAFRGRFNDEEYGRAYIDENNQLVIKLVLDDDAQSAYIKRVNLTDNLFSKNKIKIEYADYSMDYLKKIVDELTPFLEEAGLMGVGIDTEPNCIIMSASAGVDADSIRKVLSDHIAEVPEISQKIYDEDLFVIQETEWSLQNTADGICGILY